MKFIGGSLRRSPAVFGLVVMVLAAVSLRAQDKSVPPPAQLQPVAEPPPLYLDTNQPIEQRVEDLLGRMTLEEKISQVHADSKFSTAAIPRLGIPRRWIDDGPHGVREDVGPYNWRAAGHTDDFATSMPSLCALASTWNLDLAAAYGNVIGQESRKRDKDIILAPIVDIARTPLSGRIYEYFGEDPFLNARMGVNYIEGVQSNDVAACVKHFAGNNQENGRGIINMDMDERTLREIYLPPFEAAVKEARVWAVMGAYTKFRGEHCAYSDYLINKILKGEWGFQGLVMSDWGATYSTREAVLGGLDLEMGTLITGTERERPYEDYYLANPFLEGLRNGEYPVSLLDDKVRRSLRVMFATHVFDQRKPGSLNTPEHQATAQRIAEESMVLLKNNNHALPLDATKIKSVAVIGENAVRHNAAGFFGAGVKTMHEITPLEGIVDLVGSNMNVTYSVGYSKQGTDSNMVERGAHSRPSGGRRHRCRRPQPFPLSGRRRLGPDQSQLAVRPGRTDSTGRQGQPADDCRFNWRTRHRNGPVAGPGAGGAPGLVSGNGRRPRACPRPVRRGQPVGQIDRDVSETVDGIARARAGHVSRHK